MKIYKETVSDLLWETLNKLMNLKELESFRLVGGTSLSLLLGHRISIDIDLFTDSEYKSIDFIEIDKVFQNSFTYVDYGFGGNDSMGKSYLVGNNKNEAIKVDLFYTDPFVYPMIINQGIRLSQLEEIVAMKLEVIGHNGRKKDFWDIHELTNRFTIKDMLDFYEKRYPYSYTREEIIAKLTDFELADSDLDPICLKGKYWELIKLDIEEAVKECLL
ncbi:nucleotidyl transferase AbiEii/AbiGii toxin family protein [Plebeiibacterium marinum]|uniref:Nucleotidyl transferase AbiEii/AbiGii toxin family protein n=1 Tax=Plebeiibacterium marinum TaxID=2992111 RepID=A0AAE3SJQ2_9BACT|nr:nucleotidyl transferase AbiEii/AbiGii toxin family protein [Plebeiobacterium marinum]MCW3805719.1 nucleotidyl transferase AbiEii/AbiGii toxin family protein [Plebeiobacterium marinum]